MYGEVRSGEKASANWVLRDTRRNGLSEEPYSVDLHRGSPARTSIVTVVRLALCLQRQADELYLVLLGKGSLRTSPHLHRAGPR